MIVLSVYRNKSYEFKLYQLIILNLIIVITGTAGTMLMYFVETGEWGGTSFFGSVFLIPVVLSISAAGFKMTVWNMLDFCAPQICIMLAVMKIRCYVSGCCAGKVFFFGSENNILFRFPSQIAEGTVILIILYALIYWEKRNINVDKLYPCFLILYGITRFILNSFRAGLSSFVWILPNGHFWSLVAITLGLIMLGCIRKNHSS